MSGVQTSNFPWIFRGFAPPSEPVVKPELAIRPELDFKWLDPQPAPIGRPWRMGAVTRADLRDLRHQRAARRQRLRLPRGPGAEATFQRARREIGVGPFAFLAGDGAADANL